MQVLKISFRALIFAALFMLGSPWLSAQTVTVPFSLTLSCINTTQPSAGCDSVYSLPADQSLEIKNASVECGAPLESSVLSVTVTTTVGGVLGDFTPTLPATKPAFYNANSSTMRFTQLVDMYADEGSKIILQAAGNEIAPTQKFYCVVNFQGLRTAPRGSVLPPSGPNRQ